MVEVQWSVSCIHVVSVCLPPHYVWDVECCIHFCFHKQDPQVALHIFVFSNPSKAVIPSRQCEREERFMHHLGMELP